ncbi:MULTISPECIES: hypothetical protein [Methylobacter]
MTTQQRLTQLQALQDAWWKQAHSVMTDDLNYQEGKLSEIHEQIHAQQFDLLLHTPCHQLTPYLRMFW